MRLQITTQRSIQQFSVRTRATAARAARLSLALGGCLAVASACASNKPPPAVETPRKVTMTSQVGAPRDTHFTADIEATRGRVRVIVREQSVCDVIPVQNIMENNKTRQVAGDPTGTKPCARRPARNVVVSLEVDGNTFRLGEPNKNGEVEASLNDKMLQNLYGDDQSKAPVALVTVREPTGEAHQIGTVTLTQLAESERRLEELLSEFRGVLDRAQSDLSGAELARAYELYEQLSRWDGTEPRISALQALFLERLYKRKAEEADERFKNNLEALGAAKDILKNSGTTLILPSHVLGAINGSSMNPDALNWARGQVAVAIRRNPRLCGANPATGFTWSLLNLSPPPAESRLAFEMLRFAYDNPYESEITALCRRILG